MTTTEGDRVDVSVVVCTRNRAERLLTALAPILVSLDDARHAGIAAELLLVDNASTDQTPAIIKALEEQEARVRSVLAAVPGIGRARNRGLEASRGGIIIFTDDDIVVPPQWVATLARPILNGDADATVGGVQMASDLRRPWMTPGLTARYYADVPQPPARNPGMIGANMAIRRSVRERLRFDDELGTQRYPGSEDVLFYVQTLEAGFRVSGVEGAVVEHHFDPARLTIDRLESLADGYGRCDAFFYYHWLHAHLPLQRVRIWIHQAEHALRLGIARGNRFDEEVIRLRREVAFHTELQSLSGTPRRYAKRGLDLVGSVAGGDSSSPVGSPAPGTGGVG